MTNNATMIPKTKITYQEWFLEQKTRCISQAEELDDAIEMANMEKQGKSSTLIILTS